MKIQVRKWSDCARLSRSLQDAFFLLTVLAFCCAAGVTKVQGVVIVDGDGSGNITPPEDDPGFQNVGIRGAASAIYLGNRWVLTANHVGAGDVVLDGVPYAPDVNSIVRLDNPDTAANFSHQTDMLLFQLIEDPNLPALRLPCTPIALGEEIVMIGGGRNRQLNPTFWNVERVTGEGNDVWTIVASEAESNQVGYETISSKTVRWGQNIVGNINLDIDSGSGDVKSFLTEFNTPAGAIPYEAQGVVGDSGGASFRKVGPLWELTGMMHSVELRENQPGGAVTAVIGQRTYLADLYIYSDIIRAIADFEPALGDFDGDGDFLAADIDLLSEAILAGHSSCHFDLDGDNEVTPLDLDFMVAEIVQTLPGDTNLDQQVSFFDFVKLANAYGTEGGWGDGDFTGNFRVDFADFVLLSSNFGQDFPEASGTSFMAAAVPEPTGWGLLALVVWTVMRRKSRRS